MPGITDMANLADSGAFRDDERLLTQHHAALTSLQPRLSAPGGAPVRWLDLGCGRGQLLGSLRDAPEEARSRLEYVGYDIDQRFVRETARQGESLKLRSIETRVGDLADFDALLPAGVQFDFITLTNTLHEIAPCSLVRVVLDVLARLAEGGSFYAYDLEWLDEPELGALPWSSEEIQKILWRVLEALGVADYRPKAFRWRHRTTYGWSIVVEQIHIPLEHEGYY